MTRKGNLTVGTVSKSTGGGFFFSFVGTKHLPVVERIEE